MSDMNRIVKIDIDPLNPAQFFACCGLFELLSARNSAVLANFVYDQQRHRRTTFMLYDVDSLQLSQTLSTLKNAEVESVTGFSAGEAPVKLMIPEMPSIILDWWLIPDRSRKSRFKLWAGNQKTLEIVRDMIAAEWGNFNETILEYMHPMSGRFGLDPRSAWNALDFGSSPNTQSRDVYSYPAAEMLAAVGLQGFCPHNVGRSHFAYWLWTLPLPLVPSRAAVSGALTLEGSQAFAFQIDKRGSYRYFTFAKPNKEKNHEG
jgi:CRISPR-associated protein Csx14